ncbi:MAG: GTPase HflX [Spirochaetales bacterium]|nr:GTPase HflX [Spirochaetales bacterium]
MPSIEIEPDNFSQTKAFLITLQSSSISEEIALANLEELRGLTATMGLSAVGSLVVKQRENHAKLLVGSGKAEEILQAADQVQADMIVFDDDLSPTQQRNWEDFTQKIVIDRQEVILEIFSQRALTREAVLQVALARMEYSLPRLTRSYTDLSRQRGGARNNRGGGEMKLELDRRVILRKIDQFKRELIEVRAHRDRTRKQRSISPLPRAAIVGYTNAGKSTLLNSLADAGVLEQDKLFATLDPTTRKTAVASGLHILVTDTVGFIQKLPHHLVDAFRSTLEEAIYADFLLHVIDVSHPQAEQQYELTNKVLADLGAGEKPQLLVLNKADKATSINLAAWLNRFPEAISTSLVHGEGRDALKAAVARLTLRLVPPLQFQIPLERGDLVAYLRKNGQVLSEAYEEEAIEVQAQVVPALLAPVRAWIKS